MQKTWMLGLTGLCLATGALAQGPGGGHPQPRLVLDALDLNHDGVLSIEEIKAAPKSLLTLDKNGDGKISANEVMARPASADQDASELVGRLMAFDKTQKGYLIASDLPERMRSMFERGDINHDGKLTREELQAMSARQTGPEGPANRGGQGGPFRSDPLLGALDTDHNGELSAEEIGAAATSLLTLDKNGNGQIDAEEMKPRAMTPAERLHHFMDEFDANKDGRIERNETPDRMQGSAFDQIDTNHDGLLDQEELLAYFTKQAQSGAQEHQH